VKKIAVIFLSLFIMLSFTSCNKFLGGTVLDKFGMEFSSQIEMMEECLNVDLDDLTDDSIKNIYSFTDTNGNDLTINYIKLEENDDFIKNNIINSDNWQALPYDDAIENLLESSGANEQFDFTRIKNGYFTISGVCEDKDEFDFERNNFSKWYGFKIGIWNSKDKTLYFISITDQSKV